MNMINPFKKIIPGISLLSAIMLVIMAASCSGLLPPPRGNSMEMNIDLPEGLVRDLSGRAVDPAEYDYTLFISVLWDGQGNAERFKEYTYTWPAGKTTMSVTIDGVEAGDRIMIYASIWDEITQDSYSAETGLFTVMQGTNLVSLKMEKYISPDAPRLTALEASAVGSSGDSFTLVPPFDPYITRYTITVPSGVNGILVSGTPEKTDTTVIYEPGQTVSPSDGTVYIKLTSADGYINTYWIDINISGTSSGGLLGNLTVLGSTTSYAYTPAFNSELTDYTLTIPADVSTLIISASPADSSDSVYFNEIEGSNNMYTITLEEGQTAITIRAGQVSQKTYTLTITREYLGLVTVPAGSFQRDSASENITRITSSFRMGKTEVTQKQWEAVMGQGTNPSLVKIENAPVEQVSWYDTLRFCNRLSLLENKTPVYTIKNSTDPDDWLPLPSDSIQNDADWDAVTADWDADGYRLPTEMEWMWAAMGADSGNDGAENTTGYSKEFAGSTGTNSLDDYAWYSGNAQNTIHDVSQKYANELGLYDMTGNVEEWCWDLSSLSAYGSGLLVDPKGEASGSEHIYRGGAYFSASSPSCNLDNRNTDYPTTKDDSIGFRVVCLEQ
ncbi:SUMF1/EgtB/PvdO family nonheme iron enzyme [Brucepastera parasyntrophica]|uniref:SUMF1/EgtB/PvdO family nonheme iron enzyme n=1 Tax=Brucepastera parasyntrophica TaxID=2880008 RepID=UPI00210B88DC|nr:SUMF1/EgtB/PvdO family nonheme iron enzyme [Brucepastera parasyntrophica]ULQ59538.1 SUMF1/EgtB/PvdO family nonheme iron enzyme [Brucepastera parasyntrophica]